MKSNKVEFLMPRKLDLGQHVASAMVSPMHCYESRSAVEERGRAGWPLVYNGRSVMGYKLPSWQRPFVWTNDQSIKLLESSWLGLNIGTYTFNRSYDNPEFDNLLIDGQQRLQSIQDYLTDKFKVFGYFWSELPRNEQRSFEMRHFHSYITESTDDEYLRSYYDTMNFSGTAHEESQRATK